MPVPDYANLRSQAGFAWSATPLQSALREITNTNIRQFNLEPAACSDAYRRGRPLVREMFGEEIGWPGLSIPHISYGHPNGLGAELLFPEEGEVAVTHVYADRSLAAACAALEQPVDFAHAGMTQYYLDFQARMQAAFPGEHVAFSFGVEGPLTTGYLLRGDRFFTDFWDAPDEARRFMSLVTESTIAYHRFLCQLWGGPVIDPNQAFMADDIAALFPPTRFRELVLPWWDRFFAGRTTGRRMAHVEGLCLAHLPFLEEAELCFFDPSISPGLTPAAIGHGCRVPFSWLLASVHYPTVTAAEVHDWVYLAAAEGATNVDTHIESTMCNPTTVPKVRAFITAAKEVQQALKAGATRADLHAAVSAAGRARFSRPGK